MRELGRVGASVVAVEFEHRVFSPEVRHATTRRLAFRLPSLLSRLGNACRSPQGAPAARGLDDALMLGAAAVIILTCASPTSYRDAPAIARVQTTGQQAVRDPSIRKLPVMVAAAGGHARIWSAASSTTTACVRCVGGWPSTSCFGRATSTGPWRCRTPRMSPSRLPTVSRSTNPSSPARWRGRP